MRVHGYLTRRDHRPRSGAFRARGLRGGAHRVPMISSSRERRDRQDDPLARRRGGCDRRRLPGPDVQAGRARHGAVLRGDRRPDRRRVRRSSRGRPRSPASGARGRAARRQPGRFGPDQRVIALGVREAIRTLSTSSPLVLALDDAQWLDPSSARALAFALRRLSGYPVAVLAHEPTRRTLLGRVELMARSKIADLVRVEVGPLGIEQSTGPRRQVGSFAAPPLVRRVMRAREGIRSSRSRSPERCSTPTFRRSATPDPRRRRRCPPSEDRGLPATARDVDARRLRDGAPDDRDRPCVRPRWIHRRRNAARRGRGGGTPGGRRSRVGFVHPLLGLGGVLVWPRDGRGSGSMLGWPRSWSTPRNEHATSR